MEAKLRAYMEQLFTVNGQPLRSKAAIELKEEMLQNLIEKYYDLLEEGKSPEGAYNIAIASVGDVTELISQLRQEEYSMPRYSNEELQQSRNRSALLVSISVMLYILCVVPPILVKGAGGPVLMFIMIAIATGLLIYNNMTKLRYRKSDSSVAQEFRQWQEEKTDTNALSKAIRSGVFSIMLVVYFVISFSTGAWHITWIIFLITAAIENIIKAIFELKR